MWAWDLGRMKPPKTPEQLAVAIESLLGSYVDEVHRAAQQAVDHAFSRATVRTRPARRAQGSGERAGSPSKRRSADDLAELCEKLYELVCARPGEGMAVFIEETGLPLRALQRPMSKLKAEGRVRSAGERNMMRYFPAVGRRTRSAD